MLELFPAGFEERDAPAGVELAAYTDAAGEEALRRAFVAVSSDPVEEGWEDRWRSFHRGVEVGPLRVGPPWEEAPAASTPVVIDPGRAFGTGAHPTTRLSLELLLELPRGSLLDVGCGSGVLGIGGAKRGFAPVVAVDSDPAAVEAARANAAANAVRVEVRLLDALREPLPPADVAVANIALDAVAQLGRRVRCAHLVTSGYLEGDDPSIESFRRVRRRCAEGWAADVWARRE